MELLRIRAGQDKVVIIIVRSIMKSLLFIFIVLFSTASVAAHKHYYRHYGYGYTNFYYVPGKVVEKVYVPTRRGYVVDTFYPAVRYQPYRYRKHYNYYEPRGNYYW